MPTDLSNHIELNWIEKLKCIGPILAYFCDLNLPHFQLYR